MSRPVKNRTAKSYKRDIESLGRLRIAILMDNSIDATISGRVVPQLDKLVVSLIELSNSIEQKSA